MKYDFDLATLSDLGPKVKVTQNVIDCSLDHVQPFHKISYRFDLVFFNNPVNTQTDKQTQTQVKTKPWRRFYTVSHVLFSLSSQYVAMTVAYLLILKFNNVMDLCRRTHAPIIVR